MKERCTVPNNTVVFKTLLFLCVIVCLAGCRKNDDCVREKYYFSVNDVIAEVGGLTDGVVDAIGECIMYDESISCAGKGFDRLYIYPHFKIFAYGEGERFNITCIELTDSNASTERGVRIGDTESFVLEKYGNGFRRVGERMEYVGEDCVLKFYFRGGIIYSIKYVSSS